MIKRGSFLLLLLMVQVSFAGNTRHMIWDKEPIRITLPLHQERIIHFPQAVKIVDSELDKDVGVMKVQESLYLNSDKAFVNKRLVVQLMPDGDPVVLTISASNEATDVTPIDVIMAEDMKEVPNEDEELPAKSTAHENPDINAVSLTRFAIQSLYSPARLLVSPTGVTRTPMRTHKNANMVYGASVLARPVISWRGGDTYITAVELKNQLNKTVILDPRKLIGEWQTATFYPTNTLGARGAGDTTTLFVTSGLPFGEALAANKGFVR